MTKVNNIGPFPVYFRAQIAAARRGRSAESNGYATAGYVLASGLRVDFNWEYDDPDGMVDEALASDDPALAIWDVIVLTAPRCAALVPARRRAKFIEGIACAIEEGRV